MDFYKANPKKPKQGDKPPGSGDIRDFFGQPAGKAAPKGKENKQQADPPVGVRQSPRRSRPVVVKDVRRPSLVISKQEGEKSAPSTPKRPVVVITKRGSVSPAKPKPKKRKAESDGSDFEFIIDDDKESDEDEADGDFKSEASAEAEGSVAAESEDEDVIGACTPSGCPATWDSSSSRGRETCGQTAIRRLVHEGQDYQEAPGHAVRQVLFLWVATADQAGDLTAPGSSRWPRARTCAQRSRT